ncbi:hypothetical protein [Streptosporangium sp. NPDC051022]|uniref:hypothetical protein n=1 Tax=Streptosporangium sp. NPDC051022 TaxID=3155752 RepID=UPI0034401D05
MSIPMIVLTNGRADCIIQSLPSATGNVVGVGSVTIVDDSGDTDYRAWLTEEFPGCAIVPVAEQAAGYWRAMQTVWRLAADAPHVFFVEDDFTFNRPVDLAELAAVLDTYDHLTQVALLRQPWFGNEHHHGGLIEALEAQGQLFEECTDGHFWWIEHRAGFTGNPSLLPARTLAKPWPEGAWSESRFGRQLFKNRAARGAYWGRRSDPPAVTHVGHERAGYDY